MKQAGKRVLIASICLSSVAIVCAGRALSLGWFDNRIDSPVKLKGQSSSTYFYSGTGQKDNPYIITERRHLYNLAWLQYIGTFNEDEGKQYYFKVSNPDGSSTTIDCGNREIPPIGTTEQPFIGHFDGNNSVIENLVITDDRSTRTAPPNPIQNNTNYVEGSKLKHCSVIGFFGVIGYRSDNVKDIYESSAYSTSESSKRQVNSVSDIYLDNITIKPRATNVLAGILAGYVNGNRVACGTYRSKLDFNKGTTNFSTNFPKVSDYTLVGSYNSEALSWEDKPGGGQDNDWGGSIDFLSLSKRVTYILKNSSKTSLNNGTRITSDIFHVSLFSKSSNSDINPDGSISTNFSWTSFSKSGQRVGLEKTTYLPLNIDLKTATIKDVSSSGTEGSFYSSQNAKENGEPVLSTNTGYIVGEGTNDNSVPRIFNKSVNAGNYSSISHSFYLFDQKPNENDDYVEGYLESKYLSLFFCDTRSEVTTRRIKDSANSSTTFTSTGYGAAISLSSDISFDYYDNAKSNLIDRLKNSATDIAKNNKRRSLFSLNLMGTDAASYTTANISNAIINKQTYKKYPVFEGGINFSTSTNGALTMILFSSSTTGTLANFPSLLKLTRDFSSDSIKSKPIKKIYRNPLVTNQFQIEYDTPLGSPAKYPLYMDLDKIASQPFLMPNCAYYFEIPLEKGDYFLGSNKKTKDYSCFLYLDIGANANGQGETKESSISKLDFVYTKDNVIQKRRTQSLTENKDYQFSDVAFSISGTAQNEIFYFRRTTLDTSALTVFYWNNSEQHLTINPLGETTKAMEKNITNQFPLS